MNANARLALAAFLLSYGARTLWWKLRSALAWLLRRPARNPTRLLIAPQDIRTADPTIANDIYAGYFAFGGKIVNAHGRSPFDLDPPSRSWAETLHGFDWLRHLRAADTALARANARALVEDWISHGRRRNPAVAQHPSVAARRLLSWLSQSPVVLEGADGPFYRRLMKSFGQQAAALQRRLGRGLDGESRLWATLALTEIGLCAEGLPALQRLGSRPFTDELGRQILADGGHISRNPQVIADLLLDLLPLRQAYAARGAEVPAPLLNAIDRMMPMLRMFRHPDGSLALFNGIGVTRPELLATVLAYDDVHAQPLGNAPYSGYQRLDAGAAVLICDTGPPPPPLFSRRAHAGTLSFEFSSGPSRLIVNCGAPEPGRPDLVQAARLTAAHSTLVLADASSSQIVTGVPFRDLDGIILPGPTAVTMNRSFENGAVVLDTSHDGYATQGFIHHRRLALFLDGEQLEGLDRLVAGEGQPAQRDLPFAIRFHLHPSVRAAFSGAGSIALLLGNGERWRFETDAPVAAEIEESIFFAGPGGPRRTEQIVLRAGTAAVQAVAWRVVRIEAGSDGDEADAM